MQSLFYTLLLLSLSAVIAQEDVSSAVEAEDECASPSMTDYNLPLRVGALFIILGTSALGVFAPIILHKISPYTRNSIRGWILTIGKFFGTGVILATAFVHMLPESLEKFSSSCLGEGWKSYEAFGGVFCMISSFALQLLELAAVANIDRIRQKKAAEIMDADIEKRERSSDASLDTGATANQITGHMDTCHEHTHEHVHSAGLFEEEDAYKHLGTVILELGIVMHSIIIGITLSNTGSAEFITLLIALVFHQFFEGVALGTRINDMNIKGWTKPAFMGTLFMIMTPIGCAIGIGIHSSFNPRSSSSILASAILDSLSAGILLYNAYISLISQEINHSEEFRRMPFMRKFACFISMYLGAGLMALIGKWA